MRKINSALWVFLLMVCTNCSNQKPLATITVFETNGLDRVLEYVSANVPIRDRTQPSKMYTIIDLETKKSVPVQIIDSVQDRDETTLKILFPVTLKANELKTFYLESVKGLPVTISPDIQISKDRLSIENEVYSITFEKEKDPRGSQVNEIVLKELDGQLLKRDFFLIHRTPDFSNLQSEGSFNFNDLPPSSQNEVKKGMYRILKLRSGITYSVPEIALRGAYTFYSGLPYFEFESTMTMEKDITLDLLRNDEMTMDSLFTHVTYKEQKGEVKHLNLYDQELDVLEETPIPDDASFVGFYHIEKGYGLASVRMDYDNTNTDGNASPTHRPHTKISKARGNGRYWNRVLSDTVQHFQKGSRYHEKNAYLVFKVDKTAPEKEILYYQERLLHPLGVKIDQ